MRGDHWILLRRKRTEWIYGIYKHPLFHSSKETPAGLYHVGLLHYTGVTVLALERQTHRAEMPAIEMLHADTTEDRARWECLE